MGKNGRFGKDYGKVVGGETGGRPGWKGPAFVKKTEQKSKGKPPKNLETPKEDIDPEELEPVVPLELQQLLLNTYRDAFSDILTSDTLQSLLQDVKAALFERDFARAFGKSEYLEAYAARWSPSRAMCYQAILIDIQKTLAEIIQYPSNTKVESEPATENSVTLEAPKPILNAACFGGCAAEVTAFGGLLRNLQDTSASLDIASSSNGEGKDVKHAPKIDLLLVDTAGWQEVVQKLHRGLIIPPPLSKYASASARAANTSFIHAGDMKTTFSQEDALDMPQKRLGELVGTGPTLITLLFTLNELYTASIKKTTAFLLKLTIAAKQGSLLLVVDSPGSYSTTTIGTEDKKYPMKFLLDHTLLETQQSKDSEDAGGKRHETDHDWVKVISDDAKWFRIPEGLRYSIPLENMRYQIHLYRRV